MKKLPYTSDIVIARNRHKIFTVPDGEYFGYVQHMWVWLYNDNGEVIHRIDITPAIKKKVDVRVKISGTKATVYLC